MQLNEFNQTPIKRINKLNKLLSEQFGFTVKPGGSKSQLLKLRESAEQMLVAMRNSTKKFHLDPDYAKFLGIRDIANTILEGEMYAQSPAYESMCQHVQETVRELMDMGYTADEASSECMNRYRRDDRYAYDDEFVLPIVLTAAKDYVGEYGGSIEHQLDEISGQAMAKPNAQVTRCIARECGIKMQSGVSAIDDIERQLNMFSQVSSKPRDAVVNFLNELDEDSMIEGVKMFGRKISETNAFIAARRDAIKHGKKEFEIDGETYPVTGADKAEVKSIKESANKGSNYNDAAQDVASAIFHRLRVSHQDQIKSVSTVDVQRAVFDVAERRAKRGVDELGSSDVSILVNRVLDELGLNSNTNEDAGTYLPGSGPPAEVMSKLVDVDLQSLASEFEDPEVVIDFFGMEDWVKQDPETGKFYMYDGYVYHVFDDAYDMEQHAMDSIDKQGEPRYESRDTIQFGAAIRRSEAKRQSAIKKAKRWMKRTQKDAAAAAREFDLLPGDIKHLQGDVELDEAVAKISCLDCDEVSTAAAWGKNNNFCPKCKTSYQGFAVNENYLSLDDMMIAEDVDIEQAEVVMAVRALSSDLQDQIERLGRMVNEDLPPIADQIKSEMGADTARQFYDRVSELVNTQLENARQAKDSMDEAIGMLTGEEESLGLAGDADMAMGDMDADLDLGLDDEISDQDFGLGNSEEPAEEPAEEPLGRAAI